MRTRERQLLRAMPDILNYRTIFYIGISQVREEMFNLFVKKNYETTIMEAWQPNVEALRPRFPKIIQGDIRDLNALKLLPRFDIVMWWHGPEHVEERELPEILTWLHAKAKRYVIVACPWGVYKQGEVKGNPYEKHLSFLYPEFFQNLNWKTSVIGERDVRGSNLIAWKRNYEKTHLCS